tara:strand:+ start:776 stop:1027 length:252 start_codon:yes stop_codon:yes gene_type:complete
MGLQFNLIKTMTRQGLKNGILYTYDAEQEAAQDAEEEKVSKEMKTAQDALAAEEARKASIKAAAAQKLKTLGLTDDEIASLSQ